MDKKPPSTPESLPEYTACPYCKLQVQVGDPECLHCKKPLPQAGGEAGKAGRTGTAGKAWTPVTPGTAAEPPARAGYRTSGGGVWERYGKWILAGVPIVLALVVVAIIYQRWVGVRITVVPNPSLPVKATVEKKGALVLVRGTVLNEGDDVPDLSLKSIGVMVEFAYRNGRRQRQRIFPKAEFRGEGALLRGETGAFEIQAPKEGLEEVVLRSEVVDLGTKRDLVPPGGKWRVVPDGK